ncbi:hypothetical protein ACHAWF_016516 [Thalassiosira exigua]
MPKGSFSALKDVSNSTGTRYPKDSRSCAKKTSVKRKPQSSLTRPPHTSSKDAGAINIDQKNDDDPIWVTDYSEQLYEYFRAAELPIPSYMTRQREVSAKTRAVLVDWLIEVGAEHDLVPEALYLTIGVVDRFLGKEKQVRKAELQLFALGSLQIATKYEQTWHYTTKELSTLCADAFDEDQILQAERDILNALDFRITFPISHNFLVRYLKAIGEDMPGRMKQMKALSSYILDVTLLSYHMCEEYLPSELAAMSVYLARICMELKFKHLSFPPLSEMLRRHTGYSRTKLERIACDFIEEKKVIDSWGLKALKKRDGFGADRDRLLNWLIATLEA